MSGRIEESSKLKEYEKSVALIDEWFKTSTGILKIVINWMSRVSYETTEIIRWVNVHGGHLLHT